jgi:hypothetical protein
MLLTNFLEEFSFSEDEAGKVIQILRTIRTLRSKKEPVHQTKPEFIQAIVNLGYSYPPNWSELWIDLLNKFNECLETIIAMFQRKMKLKTKH